MNAAHEVCKVGWADGFDVKFASAQLSGGVFVFLDVGAAEDNHGQVAKRGRGLEPFEKAEAVHARQPQINDEKVGQRELMAIVVRRIALKIVKRLLAVVNAAYGVREFRLFAGVAEESDVVLVVLGNEYRASVAHKSPRAAPPGQRRIDFVCRSELKRAINSLSSGPALLGMESFRRMVEPVVANVVNEGASGFDAAPFDVVSASAELFGPGSVALEIGAGKDDNRELR